MTAYGRHLDVLWREVEAYLAFYSLVPRPRVPAPRPLLVERLSPYTLHR